MSKLFEVSVYGTKHVMNTDRIAYAVDWASFVRVYFSDRLYVDVDVPYEQFIQLWRKALGEDTRTAEQKQALDRLVADVCAWSANSGVQRRAEVAHMYNRYCSCADCVRTRAMRGD